jgi:hypothetical protein
LEKLRNEPIASRRTLSKEAADADGKRASIEDDRARTGMVNPEAALRRLDAFVGTWELSADFPNMPDVEMSGRAEFEWILNGTFLVERSDVSHPDAPDGFVVIGVDADGDSYTQHYFDSRGIARLYAMAFDGQVWTLTREAHDFTPLEFKQRFIGTFEDDGRTIRGRYEICHDGVTWEKDFDLTYTKVG